MDMRMMYDGRRMPPRNARGEFRRRRRGDRGMNYADMRGDGRVMHSYPTMHPQGDYARGDMNYDMARGQDMRSMDYRGGDYRGGQMMGDGHHYPEQVGGQTYYPIEAMGRFNGYWGMPQGDYGYPDMRGRRDYGYDYGYPYGDFGETLSEQELDEFCHKLMSQFDEREKQMFNKDTIMQKIKQMGKSMDGFGEKELYLATVMAYSDYKEVIGTNVDMALRLGYAWLTDKDVKVKGAQKLAVYYDEIVMGGED